MTTSALDAAFVDKAFECSVIHTLPILRADSVVIVADATI